jgi:low affinity Fe/Cu permease
VSKPRENTRPQKDGRGFSRSSERSRTKLTGGGTRVRIHDRGGGRVGLGYNGPLFQYSDTWQLVINTGTTIVTFLMVFLIQNSQNRDGAAIQVKLDELIRVSTAHNSLSVSSI